MPRPDGARHRRGGWPQAARSKRLGHDVDHDSNDPIAGDTAQQTSAAGGTRRMSAPARPRTRVLVADDNALSATSLSLLLELEGYEVATALDGQQALDRAREFRPDIALLDIGMPFLTGHQVAERIRAEPWGGSMLLIALTGWAREQDRREALTAGFDCHVSKPAQLEQILACFPTPTTAGN
jgi:CheY-like chemotaxis protein